jgi:hypothetical protein
MRMLWTAVLLLLTCGQSWATVNIDGTTQVPDHKMVRLSVKLTGDQAADWDVQPRVAVDLETTKDGRLMFVAPPGTYVVTVRLIDFAAKTFDRGDTTVVITGGGGPNPPQPPPPQPVTDPLWGPLQSAFTNDLTTPNKALCAASLARGYRGAATVTVQNPAFGTNIALFRQVSADLSALCPLPNLLTCRQLIAAELDAKLGTATATPLTQDSRNAAAVQFNRIASLLEQLK